MKKHNIKRVTHLIFLSAILCIALVACNSKVIQPEDFEAFYQKFTTDEEFQMSRIEFPLDGCETDDDTVIYWDNSEDWTPITVSIYNVDTTEFTVEKTYSPTKVELKIYIPNSGFGITKEFELIEGKWYLVLYDSMST